MSKKIMFNTLYKMNSDGERIEIPALQGPPYDDTDIKRDIKNVKANMSTITNTTGTPAQAGKVWGTTTTGAGWIDFSGGAGEYKTTEIWLGWETDSIDVSLEQPSGEVYVVFETASGKSSNVVVQYKNGSDTVDSMSILSAVGVDQKSFYTHYQRVGDLYISQKTSVASAGSAANLSIYTHPVNSNGVNITGLTIAASSALPVGTKIQVAYKV